MSDNSNPTGNSQQQGGYLDAAAKAAGVVGGHAQLAQGATQEQIGNLLNSEEWKKSGIDIKGQAAENIKQSFEEFKAQGGKDEDLVNKISSAADQACPDTGDGIGSKQTGS